MTEQQPNMSVGLSEQCNTSGEAGVEATNLMAMFSMLLDRQQNHFKMMSDYLCSTLNTFK